MAKRETSEEAPSLTGLDDDAAVDALADLGAEGLNVRPNDEDEDEAEAAAAAAAEGEEAGGQETAGEEAKEAEAEGEEAEGEEAEGEEEEGEEEATELSGIADLAKDYEISEEDFLKSVAVEVNGEKVPLSDVVASYQGGGALAGERATLDADRTAFTERETAFRAKEAEGLQALTAATEQLLTTIEGEPQIDWKELERDDPLEYVRQKQKAIERREALGVGIARMRQAETEQAEAQAHQFGDFQRSEAKLAIEKMPTWKDPAVATKAMEQTTAWLKGIGFTEDELANLADHRFIIGAFKASEHDRMLEAKPRRLKKAKQTRPIPLHARKGGGTGTRTRQRLRRALERTGDDRVAAKLLEAHV